MYRYRFVGESPEIFPVLPLVKGVTVELKPGDEIETTEVVDHARLILLSDGGGMPPEVAATTATASDSAALTASG